MLNLVRRYYVKNVVKKYIVGEYHLEQVHAHLIQQKEGPIHKPQEPVNYGTM